MIRSSECSLRTTVAFCVFACSFAAAGRGADGARAVQPVIGARVVATLQVDGLLFTSTSTPE